MGTKPGITPKSILRGYTGLGLSMGARVIFPYLTAFAVKDYRTGNLEINPDLILKYLQVPPFTVMLWMKDLAKARYVIDPHYIEKPKECVQFRFPQKVLNEINLESAPRRKSGTSDGVSVRRSSSDEDGMSDSEEA